MVECLTRGWRPAGSSLTGVTALCPWARHIINLCLVLVQPRKTCPNIIESFLTGILRIKSNQKKNKLYAEDKVSFFQSYGHNTALMVGFKPHSSWWSCSLTFINKSSLLDPDLVSFIFLFHGCISCTYWGIYQSVKLGWKSGLWIITDFLTLGMQYICEHINCSMKLLITDLYCFSSLLLRTIALNCYWLTPL